MSRPTLPITLTFQSRSFASRLVLVRSAGRGMRIAVQGANLEFDLGQTEHRYLLPEGMDNGAVLPAGVEPLDLSGAQAVQISIQAGEAHGTGRSRGALIVFDEKGAQLGIVAAPIDGPAKTFALPPGAHAGVFALRLAGSGRLADLRVEIGARFGGAGEAGLDRARFTGQPLQPASEAVLVGLVLQPGQLSPGRTYEISCAVDGGGDAPAVCSATVRGSLTSGDLFEQRVRLSLADGASEMSGVFLCPELAGDATLAIDTAGLGEAAMIGRYVLVQARSPGLNGSWRERGASDRDHYRPVGLPAGLEAPPAPPLAPDLVVAFIGSAEVQRAVEADVAVLAPEPHHWAVQLTDRRPDLLLIETSWSTSAPGWARALRGGRDADQLVSLVGWCRERRIPVVLWGREDPASLPPYRWLVELSDHVFFIDDAAARALGVKAGQRASSSGLVVNLRDFNPMRSLELGKEAEQHRRSPTIDGFWDLSKRHDLLDRADLASEAHVADSIWSFSAPRLPDIGAFRHSCLGTFDYETRRLHARHCRTYWTWSDGPAAPWLKNQRAMERAASGSATIFAGPNSAAEGRPPGALTADGLDEAQALSQTWRTQPLQFEKDRFLAFRQVAANHGFSDFLIKVLDAVGLVRPTRPAPRLAVVLCTMRPHLVERAVRWFHAQSYRNAEMIVLLHGDQACPEDFATLQSADVRFTQLGSSRTLGECLNFASDLTDADFIAKIDDDDFYGEDYLSNFALYTRIFDISLSGKAVACHDLEGFGAFWSEDRASRGWTFLPGGHVSNPLAGGTIIAKRSVLNEIGFPEDRRGGSDTAFIRSCFDAGVGALTLDPFDYALFRSEEAGFHTWNLNTDLFRATGRVLGDDWRRQLETRIIP